MLPDQKCLSPLLVNFTSTNAMKIKYREIQEYIIEGLACSGGHGSLPRGGEISAKI